MADNFGDLGNSLSRVVSIYQDIVQSQEPLRWRIKVVIRVSPRFSPLLPSFRMTWTSWVPQPLCSVQQFGCGDVLALPAIPLPDAKS